MTTKRTDIHRPSAIEPTDYEFVACIYSGSKDLDLGEALENKENREAFRRHMEYTGGKFSQHEHGGTCHICGARADYLAIFYHPATNVYIKTGEDCADKLDMGQPEAFRSLRQSIADARKCKAGKRKAEILLTEADLARAWELYNLDKPPIDEPRKPCNCGYRIDCRSCRGTGVRNNTFDFIKSIVGNIVKYGHISDKQVEFLAKLVDRIDNYAEREAEQAAKQAAERAALQPCPTGKVMITGEVISTKAVDSQYGIVYKMLVKDDRGFKVWGSIPRALELFDVEQSDEQGSWKLQRGLERGDRVSFSATVEPSNDDTHFGFYKRPTKPQLLSVIGGKLPAQE